MESHGKRRQSSAGATFAPLSLESIEPFPSVLLGIGGGSPGDATISQRGTRKGRLPPSEVIRPNLSENRSQDLFMLASVITKISRHTLTGTGYAGLANKTALVARRLDTTHGMAE